MKNFFKLFGIIALVAIIGFSMVACGGDDGGGGGGDTYRFEMLPFGWAEITFAGSNFSGSNYTMTASIFGQPLSGTGTYSVSGNTITCIVVTSTDPDDKPGDQQIFTIIDATHIRDEEKGDTWTKK